MGRYASHAGQVLGIWAIAIPATTMVFMLWFWLAPRDNVSESHYTAVEDKGGREPIGATAASTAADYQLREYIVTPEDINGRGRGLDLPMKGLSGRLRPVNVMNATTREWNGTGYV